jgi:hypothetical protein
MGSTKSRTPVTPEPDVVVTERVEVFLSAAVVERAVRTWMMSEVIAAGQAPQPADPDQMFVRFSAGNDAVEGVTFTYAPVPREGGQA